MSRVFLIEQPEPNKSTGWMPDLSSAARYGAVIPIFTRMDRVGLNLSRALQKVQASLRNYVATDHLLWVGGDPIGLMLATSYLTQRGFTKLSFLRWERTRNEEGLREGGLYTAILVDLPNGGYHS